MRYLTFALNKNSFHGLCMVWIILLKNNSMFLFSSVIFRIKEKDGAAHIERKRLCELTKNHWSHTSLASILNQQDYNSHHCHTAKEKQKGISARNFNFASAMTSNNYQCKFGILTGCSLLKFESSHIFRAEEPGIATELLFCLTRLKVFDDSICFKIGPSILLQKTKRVEIDWRNARALWLSRITPWYRRARGTQGGGTKIDFSSLRAGEEFCAVFMGLISWNGSRRIISCQNCFGWKKEKKNV